MESYKQYILRKMNEANNTSSNNDKKIETEKEFRDWAEHKFEAVFGDKLDKEKMNATIDGLLKDNKKYADEGNWAALVGMLNKSFAH